MGGACNMHGEMRNKKAYDILVGKPQGNRTLGKPRLRWKDNNVCLKEIWCGLDSAGSG
jgi:hypothetical protein